MTHLSLRVGFLTLEKARVLNGPLLELGRERSVAVGEVGLVGGALDVTSGAGCLCLGLLRRPLIDRDADLVPGQALRVGGGDVVGVRGGVGVEVLQR